MTQNLASRFKMPNSTGDWAEDNRLGRAFADKFVEDMRDGDAPMRLGNVVQNLAEAGAAHSGVPIGFFQRIAELAMR